jgi:hypothetical protein
MRSLLWRSLPGLVCLAALVGTAGQARAGMTLTAAGASAGFSLSTFADGFPNPGGGGVGPVGITFLSSGAVMVSDYFAGRNAVFGTDTDGQHYAGAALSSTNYGGNNATGLVNFNGSIYEALQGSGAVIKVDSNGNQISTVATGLSSATGIVGNPNTGNLFVSTPGPGNIWSVNPNTGVATLFKSGVDFDGMTITSDGSILYGANVANNTIQGYNTTTGALVYQSNTIGGGIDGSALGTGSLAGNIFVNTNNGNLVEVNLMTNAGTLLASGGSRGDFVSVDPNGTLLLTQTDSVLRLAPPSGGGFGGAAPEPASLTLLGIGLAAMGGYSWRRRKVVVLPAAA